MRYLIAVAFLIAAAIHLLPAVGVLGPEHLTRLYGVVVADPNLEVLMRHRAVLLATVGVLLAVSAFYAPLRLLGLFVGFVSVVSYLALAWNAGVVNVQLSRVASVDVVALLSLVAAGIGHLYVRGGT